MNEWEDRMAKSVGAVPGVNAINWDLNKFKDIGSTHDTMGKLTAGAN